MNTVLLKLTVSLIIAAQYSGQLTFDREPPVATNFRLEVPEQFRAGSGSITPVAVYSTGDVSDYEDRSTGLPIDTKSYSQLMFIKYLSQASTSSDDLLSLFIKWDTLLGDKLDVSQMFPNAEDFFSGFKVGVKIDPITKKDKLIALDTGVEFNLNALLDLMRSTPYISSSRPSNAARNTSPKTNSDNNQNNNNGTLLFDISSSTNEQKGQVSNSAPTTRANSPFY